MNSIERKNAAVAAPDNIKAWESRYQELSKRIREVPQGMERMDADAATLIKETAHMGRILTSLTMLATLENGPEQIADQLLQVHEHYLAAQSALTTITNRYVLAGEPDFERLIENVQEGSMVETDDRRTEQAMRHSVSDLIDIARSLAEGSESQTVRGWSFFQKAGGLLHPNLGRIMQARTVIRDVLQMLEQSKNSHPAATAIAQLVQATERKLDLIALTDPTVGRSRTMMAEIRKGIEQRSGTTDTKLLRISGILLAGTVLLVNVGTAIAKPIFKKGENPAEALNLVNAGWGAAMLAFLYPKFFASRSANARERIVAEARKIGPGIQAVKDLRASPQDRVAAFKQAQEMRESAAMNALLNQEKVSQEALAEVAGGTSPLAKTLAPLTDDKRSAVLQLLCTDMDASMQRSFGILLDEPMRVAERFEEMSLEHARTSIA